MTGDEEEVGGRLVCIEEMFGKFKRVKILGEEVELKGFDVRGMQVVATCQKERNGIQRFKSFFPQ